MDTNVWNEGFRTGVKAVEVAGHPGHAPEDEEKLNCPYSEMAPNFVLTADFVYRHFIHGGLGPAGVDLNHFNATRGPRDS